MSRRYVFMLRGFGDCEAHGETRSKARYELWLRFSDAWPCTFREFISMIETRPTPGDTHG